MEDVTTAIGAAGLLFVMEFADKTQLAVMSLTARDRRLFPVVAGASAALAALALLAAAVGGVLTRYLPDRWLSLGAGLSFVAFGGFMLWRAMASDRAAEAGTSPRDGSSAARPAWRYAFLTFGLIFVAELGDKSQLAVFGLVADTGRWLPVFAGAAAGLTAMTVVGAVAGSVLVRVVPAGVMRFGPGILFLVVGGLSLTGVI